jgi:hypothetical protein
MFMCIPSAIGLYALRGYTVDGDEWEVGQGIVVRVANGGAAALGVGRMEGTTPG